MKSNLAEELFEANEAAQYRRERLYDERRARKAMRRTAKAMCMWLGGAMFVASMFAAGVGMTREAVCSALLAVGATVYGGAGWIRLVWW